MHVTPAAGAPAGAAPGAPSIEVPPPARRWFGVGACADPDPAGAGAAATRAALRGPDARLLLAFCSALHDPAAVAAGIAAAGPGVPLIGCSSTMVIGPGLAPGDAGGVAVVALGGAGFSVVTTAVRGADNHQREVGAAAAGCVAGIEDRPHRVLVLLTDGLVAGQEEVLAGAYRTVGASVPLIGGSASPHTSAGRTFQFHGGPDGVEVLDNAVVAAAIGADAPLGIGLAHGWRTVGEPMIVTQSAGGDVYTLDDQPALTAYLRRLDAPAAAYTDPAAFERFAQTRPIGVRRRSGAEVRNVSSTALLADGWLRSSGDVPEGGLIWPMEGDRRSVLDAAGEAGRAAVTALGGAAPIGLIAFDCESRARLLGTAGTAEEQARMAATADRVPVAGLYTWGEIARVRGINGFHNQSLVVLAVS